jgi:hypothetical protein
MSLTHIEGMHNALEHRIELVQALTQQARNCGIDFDNLEFIAGYRCFQGQANATSDASASGGDRLTR